MCTEVLCRHPIDSLGSVESPFAALGRGQRHAMADFEAPGIEPRLGLDNVEDSRTVSGRIVNRAVRTLH